MNQNLACQELQIRLKNGPKWPQKRSQNIKFKSIPRRTLLSWRTVSWRMVSWRIVLARSTVARLHHGTRCRDGVNVLWCRSHLVWLVFEGSIPTCACSSCVLTHAVGSLPPTPNFLRAPCGLVRRVCRARSYSEVLFKALTLLVNILFISGYRSKDVHHIL